MKLGLACSIELWMNTGRDESVKKSREHKTIFEKSNSRLTLHLPFQIGDAKKDYCGFLKVGSPFLNADH